ncbi:lysophospholipid acyltransferase family protein [Desulfosediminicola flagellatus]|uniref:lysophospholipid acyltransferase family protein n=1 Tax=Desulfosediminicola flagellatus TaxID=2569541 RepID=UPI0010AC1429|nr:lysophospholipid acyltransferase family protein [Desulfosediminicola flagellatus]
MSLKHRFEYGILRSIIFFINLLPVPVIIWFSGLLGKLAWLVFPFRLDVAYKNLSNVFPQKDHSQKLSILRRTYLQFAKTFGLIFILHRKKLLELVKNTEITGLEKVEAALKEGKGVILTTYHGCWFEAYFAWFNLSGLPTSLIYQKQSNILSDAYFVRQRNKYGNSLEHVNSWSGMKEFQDALDRNRLLIISLDQSYSHRGTEVQFFNTPLKCAKGSAVLHLRTGAPVLTSVYYMKDDKLHIDFDTVDLPAYDEINDENIQEITQKSICKYESHIREYPEQWFSLFHRLWSKKGYSKVSRSLKEAFFS